MWPGVLVVLMVLVPRCLAFRQVGINLRVMVYNPNPRTRDEETDRNSEVTFMDQGIPRDTNKPLRSLRTQEKDRDG